MFDCSTIKKYNCAYLASDEQTCARIVLTVIIIDYISDVINHHVSG